MYAGEHAAGTEFMIGPLFLTAGVSAFRFNSGIIIRQFNGCIELAFFNC